MGLFDDVLGPAPNAGRSGLFDDVLKKSDVGQFNALLAGVSQGLTANFGDELAGLGAAATAGTPIPAAVGSVNIPGLPPGTVVGAARLAGEYLAGKRGPATEAYEKARDEARDVSKTAKEQYPKTTLGGELLGGVALPVGGVLNAATLPARMGRGAAVGATYGAAAGAGEGENLADRAARGATGAGLGAVAGAAAPPLVEGALQAGRYLARPVANALRGAVNPDLEAARRVAGSLERDIRQDPAAAGRLTPQEFGQNAQSATIMDIGGEATRALARSAANTSPEGRQALNNAINDRFEGQTGRITDWLRQTFHYPNAAAQEQALQQSARHFNRGNYQRAYQDGANGLWSPELERLAGSNSVSSAMQNAVKNAGDESIISGYGAMNPRISFTSDGRIQFARQPNGMPTYPDLQYWDLVRRELSDAAQRAGRGTTEARRLGHFADRLNTELDRLVPSYRQAREGAASFFEARNALEAGQNFVTLNRGMDESRRMLARMAPLERQLFQDGFVSRFIETINRTGDRRNVLNQIAQSPLAREKLNLALGPQRANELEAMLRVEGIMDLARGAVQGNSTTARQLAELGLAGGFGASGLYNMDTSQMVLAALIAGRRGIDQRVARHVAEMLTSNDPRQLVQGIRLVARNNRMMDSLRIIDRKIAAAGSEQVPTGLAVQAPVPARAEDEK